MMTERFVWHYNQVSCTLFFFYFLCLFGYFRVDCSSSFHYSSPKTTHFCPPEEGLALLQFRNKTFFSSGSYSYCNGQIFYPKTNSWTEGTDCCSWDGVTCDNVTGNVIGLDSSCSRLEGSIDDNSSLFHLSHLQSLNLAFNDFGGSQISPVISRLKELTYLNLSSSYFGGLVPYEISHLSKLTHLELSENDLTIEEKTFDLLVSNLTKLSLLKLGATNLSLIKPFSLINLSSTMTDLDLNRASIQGNFPDEIFRLPNLQALNLQGNNQLTGYLPNSNWSSPLRKLHLSSTNFAGKIPDSIGNLLFLEIVHIGGCNFTGSIPSSIGNLTRATEILFASNYLTGHLPHHVSGLSYLTTLDLSGNSLQGRVPSWLFTLPSLVSIDLSNNMLNGPINPFQSPNSLQEVRLQKNEIHGTIPNSIFQLVNLTYLDLTSNNLSGTVKFDMFSKLQSLQYLYLSNNSLLSFTSSSNMDIKYSLPSLQELNLSNCNINQFPSFLRNSEKLTSLDLSNGRIRGRISKHDSKGWKSLIDLHLCNNFLTHIALHPWKNIKTLDLRNNKIQGSILVPPPSTQVFLVSNNKLSGAIPPSICSLSSLQYLSLSHNNLSGTIPSCLGNFSTQLIILDLKNNSLEGHIHDNFANASYLRSLDLNSNKLEGPLPRSLANCRILEVVNVGKNMISDTFPCWLGSLSELKILVLRSNRFYGPLCKSNSTFPFQALRIIDLSHNEFTGSLPRTIFVSMEAMKIVDEMEFGLQYIGGFYYLDSVTVAMKGQDVLLYKILIIFRTLDFSSNRFHGEVPEVLGNFKSLKVLNLSHNSLTGNIPASLGNMTALESLDLSFNKLHGIIPEQLLAVTALASLNLSYNQLRGRIPRGNQFNTFDNNSYIGNIHLCGEPLTATCSNDGLPKAPPSASTDHEEDETASWLDWKMAKLGYASGLVIGLSIGYMVLSIGGPRWLVKMVERDQQNKVRRPRPRHRM
ncbi:Receptor-like protein 6 [Citrus sinensis]|uniref:Receptor-like protein 6 n=1 Tax=Citrus sinensis TaxID=2711 RepID=A0ACB8M216_CITSI|nr:Receptor-like protein 6 [Citrus sinensis]